MTPLRALGRLAVLLVLAAWTHAAAAHRPSDAYLVLARDGAAVTGQWDIALRDLDLAVGLDTDGDGAVTWGELAGRRAAIESYALARLALASDGVACPLAAADLLVDRRGDDGYAVLILAGNCPRAGATLDLDYRLLADVDPQHRGLVSCAVAGREENTVLGGERSSHRFGSPAGTAAATFATYAREGVFHIWEGYDHLLFLLSLLLPAVLVRRDGRWEAAASLRAVAVDVAKVVTAFTLAHSVTLSLAALGLVALPSRAVESAIALSVLLAALNNLRPVVARRRWVAAFGFGLLHGFGFAGALAQLGLPAGSLALSLAGFNLGVEIGQLAVVAAFLPGAYALRERPGYARYLVGGGSTAIAALALAWLAERAFDVSLLPGSGA